MNLNEDEKRLMKEFRELRPENQAIAQSAITVALAAQENTKKAMENMGKETGKKGEKKIA